MAALIVFSTIAGITALNVAVSMGADLARGA
jgi:hypothetical protein